MYDEALVMEECFVSFQFRQQTTRKLGDPMFADGAVISLDQASGNLVSYQIESFIIQLYL